MIEVAFKIYDIHVATYTCSFMAIAVEFKMYLFTFTVFARELVVGTAIIIIFEARSWACSGYRSKK